MAEPATDRERNGTWVPQPYAERKSQHVTFGDYVGRALFKLVAGGTAGWAVGAMIDRMRDVKRKGGVRVAGITSMIGAMVGSYFTWQRAEKSMLEVDTVYTNYRDLPGLRQTNDELERDNALLKRMAAHQQAQLGLPATQASAASYEGRALAPEREQQR